MAGFGAGVVGAESVTDAFFVRRLVRVWRPVFAFVLADPLLVLADSLADSTVSTTVVAAVVAAAEERFLRVVGRGANRAGGDEIGVGPSIRRRACLRPPVRRACSM